MTIRKKKVNIIKHNKVKIFKIIDSGNLEVCFENMVVDNKIIFVFTNTGGGGSRDFEKRGRYMSATMVDRRRKF